MHLNWNTRCSPFILRSIFSWASFTVYSADIWLKFITPFALVLLRYSYSFLKYLNVFLSRTKYLFCHTLINVGLCLNMYPFCKNSFLTGFGSWTTLRAFIKDIDSPLDGASPYFKLSRSFPCVSKIPSSLFPFWKLTSYSDPRLNLSSSNSLCIPKSSPESSSSKCW